MRIPAISPTKLVRNILVLPNQRKTDLHTPNLSIYLPLHGLKKLSISIMGNGAIPYQQSLEASYAGHCTKVWGLRVENIRIFEP